MDRKGAGRGRGTTQPFTTWTPQTAECRTAWTPFYIRHNISSGNDCSVTGRLFQCNSLWLKNRKKNSHGIGRILSYAKSALVRPLLQNKTPMKAPSAGLNSVQGFPSCINKPRVHQDFFASLPSYASALWCAYILHCGKRKEL